MNAKYKVCRLCTCDDGSLMDITEECGKLDFVVVDTIKDLLQFDVDEDAEFPWMICSPCLVQLSNFRRFKERCVQSKIEFENRHQLIEHSYSMFWGSPNHGRDGGHPQIVDALDNAPVGDPPSSTGQVGESMNSTSVDSLGQRNRLTGIVTANNTKGTNSEKEEYLRCPLVEKKPVLENTVSTCALQRGVEPHCNVTNEKVGFHAELGGRETKVQSIQCAISREVLQRETALGVQARKVGRFVFGCCRCTKTFGTKRKLKAHRLTHMSTEFFRWEIPVDEPNKIPPPRLNSDRVEKYSVSVHLEGLQPSENTTIEEVELGIIDQSNELEAMSEDIEKSERVLFVCMNCKEVFVSKVDLDEHLVACGLNESDENVLEHSQTECNVLSPNGTVEEALFSCRICGKGFRRKRTLYAHMSTNCGQDLFSCECGKSYRSRSGLKNHIEYRHSDGIHTCEICDKVFRNKYALKEHMVVHTGARRYKCHLCAETFSRSSSFKAHLPIHSNRRPFPCSLCNRVFKNKGWLMDHYRVHTSSAPFRCGSCDKCFMFRGNLSFHMKRHHNL